MYFGVESRFFNLNSKSSEINPQMRPVSHEFSHQFWGGYIDPSDAPGYPLLTETLAKYSELAITDSVYGKYASKAYVSESIERYLRTRAYDDEIEQPLSKVIKSSHVYYDKGKQAMAALSDLIGRGKLNHALRGFLEKNGYPNKPTSEQLLMEFYSVATPEKIEIIKDLFTRVVFHDLKLETYTINKLNNGKYEIIINTKTRKFVVDEKSNLEVEEDIFDELEIAFYSDIPDEQNKNMTYIKKFIFNSLNTEIRIISDNIPEYIQIDPNRYRIDRNFNDNLLKVNF
jgi:hypothetical protein